MSFRVGLAQCSFPASGDVVAQVSHFAAQAEEEGVQLLVFPENLMSPPGTSLEDLLQRAQPPDGPYVHSLSSIARERGLWMAFTMSETRAAQDDSPLAQALPPYNTAVMVDDAGTIRARYRKCHLYDAHGIRESDRMSAGDVLCPPIRAPFGTIGLAICYDLRFPEAVRATAASCDLLLYLAAWHDGPHKPEHWRTLLRARAIENECYVAGVCRAEDELVEQSLVSSPLGEVVACAHSGEQLLVADIDPKAVQAAREAMPVFAHRRPELY